jgi:2-succinyl-5-enolpyruvyl-6-hydroxy-3-cyclohexene-1-carboxylate synthase
MPHATDLCQIARGFGWQAERVDSRAAFEQALDSALAGGRHVIEVPVVRAANTAFHRALYDHVCRALQQEPRT